MKGAKTGGRQAGTPNKKSTAIRDLIAHHYPDYHPVLSLAKIAQDERHEVTIRLQAHKEVAKYICPQLKSIEIADKQVQRIVVVDDQSTCTSFSVGDNERW